MCIRDRFIDAVITLKPIIETQGTSFILLLHPVEQMGLTLSLIHIFIETACISGSYGSVRFYDRFQLCKDFHGSCRLYKFIGIEDKTGFLFLYFDRKDLFFKISGSDRLGSPVLAFYCEGILFFL